LVIAISICLIVLGFATFGKAANTLAATDAIYFREGLKAAKDSKTDATLAWTRKTKDPLARKILTWARLIKPDPNADFKELSNFIANNPDWPDQISLQRLAEESMKLNTPDELILGFFQTRQPLTGYGKNRLGQVFLNQGHSEEGKALIRDAWINGNFSKFREKTIYKRYQKLLHIEDHYRRLDRLQWQGRYWPVRRMLWKVPSDYRALSVARMFLRHNLGNVDFAIKKVPARLKNDVGLKYERLRWRLQEGKFESAMEILNEQDIKLVQPSLWWKKRQIVVRYLLHKGDAKSAYLLARDHRIDANDVKDVVAYSEAEWLAGWIALQFLNNAKVAEVHFKKMYKVVRFPISRSRGAYWIARAIGALRSPKKDPASIEIWYKRAALHSTTYYGQLSIAHLQGTKGVELTPQPVLLKHQIKSFNANELTRAVHMLVYVNKTNWLKPFIMALNKVNDKPWWRQSTIKLSQALGRNDLSLKIAKLEGMESWNFTEAAFPKTIPLYEIRSKKVLGSPEDPLILAIVRQESAFYIKARSHANAQGLMQLLPSTASQISKKLKIPYSIKRLTNDAVYNLTLGKAYLAGLLKTFKGSYVLALSAYNAGPIRVKQWMRKFGDPRNYEVDAVDWVESIPFPETRNYVQRVLENLQVYRHLLANDEVHLTLNDDLYK